MFKKILILSALVFSACSSVEDVPLPITTSSEKALELYKKVKGDTKSGSYKKAIGLLKKLNDEKKKLAKEMDMAVSSKMRNVGYAGPLD